MIENNEIKKTRSGVSSVWIFENQQYNVFYLMHEAGATEYVPWNAGSSGRFKNVLDHAIEDGKCSQ